MLVCSSSSTLTSGQADLALMRRKKALHALALGIECIGLVSLRFPLAVALVVIALAIAAGFGVARIEVDDSLSQLFRSDTPGVQAI